MRYAFLALSFLLAAAGCGADKALVHNEKVGHYLKQAGDEFTEIDGTAVALENGEVEVKAAVPMIRASVKDGQAALTGAATEIKAHGEEIKKLKKQVDWLDRYGDRLFNLSCLAFFLGAVCVVGVGLSFYPKTALLLRPWRLWLLGGAGVFAVSGVAGMQYLEHHDDIWQVVKWTLIISIPLLLAAGGIYATIRVSQEKKERKAEQEAADARKAITDIVLAKIKAAHDTNGDGKFNRADLLPELYARTSSRFHYIVDEVLTALGLTA